jgi:type I restriction enzyme S subunit
MEIFLYMGGGIMRFVDQAIFNDESILLPRKGTLSNIQYVNKPFWVVDTIYYSIINKNLANPFYLFNFLKLLDLSKLNTGTGVPSMTFDAYYNLDIELPSIEIQQKIASILSTLDAKIELNHRINAKLEETAKTLYDYWFVQFDFPNSDGKPYKASGGKMVWNKELKREIPDGWGYGNLCDIAEYVNGLACQKFRPKVGENCLPVIKIREMHSGISKDTELVSTNIPNKYKINSGDILFSWSATLEIHYWCEGNAVLNQHIFKVIPTNFYSKEYVYHQLATYIINFIKIADSRKTTMGHITKDHLFQSQIVLPPQNIIGDFDVIVQPLRNKIITYKQENQKLTEIRDTLLPLLMNGQVKID